MSINSYSNGEDLLDATQGDETIEISIQDNEGCRPPIRYTLPIIQPGQSFALIRANLLYPKDRCSKPLKNIFVTIRIVRGFQRQLIYTSDYILLAPYYADGNICRLPIRRVWYWEDYVRLILRRVLI